MKVGLACDEIFLKYPPYRLSIPCTSCPKLIK